MATRTISNTGGNYNATTTWVEGIVPTSADDVVSTATSGQLTVNVSSAARSIDFTTYTNTLTVNANLTLNTTGLTHTFGSGMTFASTAPTARISFDQAATIVQNTTARIPGLRFGGVGIKTLSTNIYCTNFSTNESSTTTINGNILYTNGNVGTFIGAGTITAIGTTKIVLDGSGIISQTFNNEVEINTTGTYSTNYTGLMLGALNAGLQAPILNIVAGNFHSDFFVLIGKATTGTQTLTIGTAVKIPNVSIYTQVTSTLPITNRNLNITLTTPLIVENLSTSAFSRLGTSDNGLPLVSIYGNGLSASNIYLNPATRVGSSATVFETIYKAIDLRLNSDFTHNIGSLSAIGGLTSNRPTISSITASLPCSLKLGSKETSQIINYNFTDVNASAGAQVVAINSTLSNTTNITNVYPSGGGSAGGAWTFVS